MLTFALAVGLLTPAPPARLRVEDIAQAVSLDWGKVGYDDEPPGKLRAVEGQGHLGAGRVPVHVRVELVYTDRLFSEHRAWERKVLLGAEVRQPARLVLPVIEESKHQRPDDQEGKNASQRWKASLNSYFYRLDLTASAMQEPCA